MNTYAHDIFFLLPNDSASPAPKANEGLARMKFYAEMAKAKKRPGFGC